MYNSFKEYYRYTDEEISLLWEKALIIFDTNVILNLYRYSSSTKEQFFKLINDLKDRIWIPYHVGKEFHNERLVVISQQKKIYFETSKKLKELFSQFKNENRSPFLSQNLFNELSTIVYKIEKELKDQEINFDKLLNDDSLLTEITKLFEGKVGESYSLKRLEEISNEGEKRYKQDIPPGFKDKSKNINKFGDLIIWNQIIDKSKKDNRPIIFVTDDEKEDWWRIESGKYISPREELIKEFQEKAKNLFYMYKPFRFLEYSKQFLNGNIEQNTIEEVKNLSPLNPENNELTKSILIIIKTKSCDGENNIIKYVENIKNLGYDISFKKEEETNFTLNIIIPDFPDLGRRFKEKFLPLLENYNIELISYNVE